MLWFNEDKGFGFISTDEGERLYVDGAGFAGGHHPKGRCVGLAVSFRVIDDADGRRGEATVLEPEISPRRARPRHGNRPRL